jgi:hypothetical protein
MKTFRLTIGIVILVVVVVLCGSIVYYNQYPFGSGEWQSVSPDGKYKIVAYTKLTLALGQGSDAPGIIELKDALSGKILEKAQIPMMSMVSKADVSWGKNFVSVLRPNADWNLPANKKEH